MSGLKLHFYNLFIRFVATTCFSRKGCTERAGTYAYRGGAFPHLNKGLHGTCRNVSFCSVVFLNVGGRFAEHIQDMSERQENN